MCFGSAQRNPLLNQREVLPEPKHNQKPDHFQFRSHSINISHFNIRQSFWSRIFLLERDGSGESFSRIFRHSGVPTECSKRQTLLSGRKSGVALLNSPVNDFGPRKKIEKMKISRKKFFFQNMPSLKNTWFKGLSHSVPDVEMRAKRA